MRRNKTREVRSNIGVADERSTLSLASNQTYNGPFSSDGIKALLVHQQRVASLRADVQIARTQLRGRRQSWMQYNLYFSEALEQHMDLVRCLILQPDRMLALQEKLEDAYADVMSSKDDFYEEEEKTKELVNQVSNLEYQYGLQEKALCERIARTTGLPLPAEILLDERVGLVRSDSDKPDLLPKKIPKALREYYDKAGDITIFRERLLHMQADHNQEAMARENRVNLGQPVSPSDIEFYDNHQREYQETLNELIHTEAEADRLRTICFQKRLNPETGKVIERKPPREEIRGIASIPASVTVKSEPSMAPLYQVLYNNTTSIGRQITEIASTKSRINEWLRGVFRHAEMDFARLSQETKIHVPDPVVPPVGNDSGKGASSDPSDQLPVEQLSHTSSLSGRGTANEDGKGRSRWHGDYGMGRRHSEPTLAGIKLSSARHQLFDLASVV